jgi:hypothetical protein
MLKKNNSYIGIVSIIYCSLIFVGCGHNLTQLQREWPIKTGWTNQYSTFPVQRGCIILRSKDTLCGIIKLLPNGQRIHYAYIQILQNSMKDAKDVIKIEKNDIEFINIYKYNGNIQSKSIDYYYLGNKFSSDYWRIIGKRNGATIYISDYPNNESDDWNDSNQDYYQLLLTSKKDTTIIGTYQSLLRSDKSSHRTIKNTKILLKFINKHYSQHFNKEDFKNNQALLDYILDKENERLNNNNNKP